MTAPRPRRNTGPRPGRAEQRRRLLESAAALFARQGVAATTTEQIASAAGLTHSALNKLFAARPALFGALLDDVDTAIQAVAPEAPSDPPARLHALAEGLVAAARSHGPALRAFTRALAEDLDELRPTLAAFAQAWQDRLVGIIAEGQQSGFFRRSLDPQVGAWQLIHAALAVPLTAPLGVGPHAHADYPARAIECALHALLKTDV